MSSKFVNEEIIDLAIVQLEDESLLLAIEERWSEHYIAVDNYLRQESFELLTVEEITFLKTIISIIWISWEHVHGSIASDLNARQLEKIEEANWQNFHSSKEKRFRDKLNVFFEDHPQEDLLAFVEDSLEDDEEQMVTGPARDIIWISAVSFIDALIQHSRFST